MIENFCDRHPGVVLDIYEEEWITFAAKLRDRSIDFVLQRLHGRPQLDDPTFDDLNVETLFEDELVVASVETTRGDVVARLILPNSSTSRGSSQHPPVGITASYPRRA
jgi:hypothetical protein